MSLKGIQGTPAVLIGVGTIVALQVAFTYLPIFQTLFDTRAVALADGLAIIGLGVLLLLILEVEKRFRQKIMDRPASAP